MRYAYLIITSTPTGAVDDAMLLTIQAAASRNNAKADVTGVLLYGGGKFLQALEGPEEAINALFARVSADPRHTDIEVRYRGTCSQRAFLSWSMGVLSHKQTTPITAEEVEKILSELSSGVQACHAHVLRDVCEAFALDVRRFAAAV